MSDVVGGVSVLVSADTTDLAAEMAAGMEAALAEATSVLGTGLEAMGTQLSLFGKEFTQELGIVDWAEQLTLALGPIRGEVDELSVAFEKLHDTLPFSLAGGGGFNAQAQAIAAAIREANAAAVQWAAEGSRSMDDALIQSAADAKNAELAFLDLSTQLGAINARMAEGVAPANELSVAMEKVIGTMPEAADATLSMDTATVGLAAAIEEAQAASVKFASGGAIALRDALEGDAASAEAATTEIGASIAAISTASSGIGASAGKGLNFGSLISGATQGFGNLFDLLGAIGPEGEIAGQALSTAFGAVGNVVGGVAGAIQDTLGSALDAISHQAEGLSTILVAGVAGALYEGLKAANQFAKVQDTFTAITGSATQAQDIIQGLRQTAINTGQSFDNLSRFTQQLAAAGVSNVTQVANALATYATAFGRNTQSMQRAATQLQEIQLKGTVQATQLNALVRDGVPAYQALVVAAENAGLATKGSADAAQQASDAMKAGKISAQDFFNALSDPSVIGKAQTTVASLSNNIGFQFQKLQTEVQHTLGQLFTPLLQNMGTALKPVTDALGRITLDAPGLKDVGDAIAKVFNGTVAVAAKAVGDALNWVDAQLKKLGENQSVTDFTDKLTKWEPLLLTIIGFVGSLGITGLASFVPFLNIGVNPLVGAFGTLALSVKSVRDDLGYLGDAFSKVAGVVVTALNPALQWVQNQFNTIASAMKPFLQNLGPDVDDLVKAIQTGNWDKAKQAITEIGTDLGDAFVAGVDTTIKSQDWQTIGKSLEPQLRKFLDGLKTALISVLSQENWTTFGEALAKVIGNALVTLGPVIALYLTEAFAEGELIAGETLIGVIAGLGNQLLDGFGQMLGHVGQSILQWFKNLPHMIEQALNGLVDAVTGPFKTAFDQLIGHSIIPEGINQIVAAFAGLPGAILGALGGLVGGVVGTFATMVGGVFGQVGAMVGGVLGQFGNMIGGAVGRAAQMASSVVAQVGAMAGAAFGAAANFGANVASGISSGVGTAMNAASSLVKSAINAAQGAVSGVLDIGKSIAQGIAQGISNSVGDVTSAAGSVVKQAISAAESATQKGSPSKLTRDLVGKPLGEGIAWGIDLSVSKVQQSATAAVQGAVVAVQAATASVTSTAASSGVGAAGGGVSITNNAYGPDPASVISELNRQQQFKLAALGVA